jgi:magnesium transporter
MIHHYLRQTVEEPVSDVDEVTPGVWTHVAGHSKAEIDSVIADYELEETIVEDIKDFFEVPRFELENGKAYFFTRYPYDVKDHDIDTAPILFVLGETSLITIAEQEVPFLKSFADGKRTYVTTGNTHLFLEFLTALMVAYERKLTKTRKEVYRDMGRVRSIRGKDLQRLVFVEQELNEVISALIPTNQWFAQLAKGTHIKFGEEDRELLEDLLIDCGQLIDSAKSILKTIQNIRGASEVVLTQSLNNTIRTLTAVTIILTIPTLVSSLFGMNVANPLEDYAHAFWIVLGIIMVLVLATIHFFSKNRWM